MPLARAGARLLFLAAFSLAAILTASSERSSAQVQDGATMTVLRGQVAVIRPDGTAVQPAPSGTVVQVGDEIRTLPSSDALITFFAGTEIEIGEATILVVERASTRDGVVDISLKQVFGATLHRVQTFTDPRSVYRVEAGGAVALVRGTVFIVYGPTPEGIVAVACVEDCRHSEFVGCALAPGLGYWVLVEGGRVQTSCESFAVTGNPYDAVLDAVTSALQELQGDTHNLSPGIVPSGQQQQIDKDLTNRDQERDDKDNNPAPPTIQPSPPPGVPAVSINDVVVIEGNSGTTNAIFTLSLTSAPMASGTVSFATANANAVGGTCGTAGVDFQPASGTVTFAPGETSKSVAVAVCGDLAQEPLETFAINLSNPINLVLGQPHGTGTIVDDDLPQGPPAPSLSINDVAVAEGNSGTTTATFTVSLSFASPLPVSVSVSSASGTASAGVACAANVDFQQVGGLLTFAPGVTSQTVSVPVCGDLLVEPNETFTVVLSGATNATIADGTGVGTILNDDAPPLPSLSIGDVTVSETAPGGAVARASIGASQVPAQFTVTLSLASSQPASVNFATADGTATGGTSCTPGIDYISRTGTLDFPPQQTTLTIDVIVCEDTLDEPDETFFVTLSGPVNATITDGQGQATIVDDDGPVSLSIDSVSLPEGTSATPGATTAFTFTVSASGPTLAPITFDFTTGGAALAGPACTGLVDYMTTSGTSSLPASPASAPSTTITVPVCADSLFELSDTFTVTLSNIAGATAGTVVGTGTIQNDDAQPSVSINDPSPFPEGNGSSTSTGTFTVSLSAASGLDVQIAFSTANGTATGGAACGAGVDFVQIGSGSVTIPAGSLNAPISVTICGDDVFEGDQTLLVNVSSASNASVLDPQGTGTIDDDDALPSLTITDTSVVEGTPTGIGSLSTATVTVTKSGQTEVAVQVTYRTSDGAPPDCGSPPLPGCATLSDHDYVQITDTILVFAPNETTKQIAVTIVHDFADEADNEVFFVNLLNPQDATIGDPDSRGKITIIDDDIPL